MPTGTKSWQNWLPSKNASIAKIEPENSFLVV
jgi:hypothetical protein